MWRGMLRLRLLVGMLLGAVCGQLLYQHAGPLYEANTQIRVSRRATLPGRIEPHREWSVDAAEPIEHLAMLRSPVILGRAVATRGLHDLPSLADVEHPVADLQDRLTVTQSREAQDTGAMLFELRFVSSSLIDAQRVLNALVASYRDHLQTSHQERLGEMLSELELAGWQLSQELREQQSAHAAFREQLPAEWKLALAGGSGDVQKNVHAARLQTLDAARHRVLLQQAELRVRRAVLEQAEAAGESAAVLNELVREFQAIECHGMGAVAARIVPLWQAVETIVWFSLEDGPRTRPAALRREPIADYLRVLHLRLAEAKQRAEALNEQLQTEARLAGEFATVQLRDRRYLKTIQERTALLEDLDRQARDVLLERDRAEYAVELLAPISSRRCLERRVGFLAAGICAGLLLAVMPFRWRASLRRDASRISTSQTARALPSGTPAD